ncbi:hypothetical protein D3C73_1208420 [compost metagenome]
MIAGQRLGVEHIQRSASDLALFEHLNQVVFDQMFATADVDQVRIGQQLRQRVAIQDAMGVGRQRQHVHQKARPGQKGRQGSFARKGFHAGQITWGSRPARHGIAEVSQRLRDARAHLSHTQHANRPIRLARALAGIPMLARLRLVERFEIARHAQQRVQRVFGHLH